VEADCQLLGGKSQALQEEASLMHHIMSRLRRYQDERSETSGLKWKLPPGGQPICLFAAMNNPSKNNRPIIRPNDDSKREPISTIVYDATREIIINYRRDVCI